MIFANWSDINELAYGMVTKKENEMKEFKTWEEMSTLEQMACQFWDMYKDAFGIRPRGIDTSSWTEQDFIREFEFLRRAIEIENASRKSSEANAIQQFEGRIDKLLRMGAHNRAMAMRWILQAEQTNGEWEHSGYSVGLPYGYFRMVA